jgi:hypothetical protein
MNRMMTPFNMRLVVNAHFKRSGAKKGRLQIEERRQRNFQTMQSSAAAFADAFQASAEQGNETPKLKFRLVAERSEKFPNYAVECSRLRRCFFKASAEQGNETPKLKFRLVAERSEKFPNYAVE